MYVCYDFRGLWTSSCDDAGFEVKSDTNGGRVDIIIANQPFGELVELLSEEVGGIRCACSRRQRLRCVCGERNRGNGWNGVGISVGGISAVCVGSGVSVSIAVVGEGLSVGPGVFV